MADNFAELATMSEVYDLRQREAADIVSGMDSTNAMYCSFNPETPAEKAKLFNAVSCEGLPLIENTGKPIPMIDVIVQAVELENDDGTTAVCPRSSIIAANGDVYTATSWGLYRALQRINNLYGSLHFDPKKPLTIEASRIKTKKGQTINLKIV